MKNKSVIETNGGVTQEMHFLGCERLLVETISYLTLKLYLPCLGVTKLHSKWLRAYLGISQRISN